MGQISPDPWEYVPGNEYHGPYVATIFGSTVCDCYTVIPSTSITTEPRRLHLFCGSDAETNARLIAAAPELLEALEMVFVLLSTNVTLNNTDLEQVSAAINKARGI